MDAATPDLEEDVPSGPRAAPLALASLLTGIIAVLGCGLGVVAGPTAVVLGAVAGRRDGFTARPVAGILLGSLGFLGSGVLLLYLLGL